MEKKKLNTSVILDKGYGNHFGFNADGSWWASASPGILHVWNQFNLVRSYEIPGFAKGNIVFINDDVIRIGLFEINFRSDKQIYFHQIAENFAQGCTPARPAHYSQYKISEVLNFETKDLLLVSLAHQPSKVYGVKEIFEGPTNRLLLFNSRNSELLKIVAENYEGRSYRNLVAWGERLFFSVDGESCFLFRMNDAVNKFPAVHGFIPMRAINNFVAGSYDYKYVQFRNTSDLEVNWQLPMVYESVHQIDGFAGLILAGVNDNLLQLWKIGANETAPDYQISCPGNIEGISLAADGRFFIALAGTENTIWVMEVE